VITKNQIKAVRTLASRVFPTDDDYRAMLYTMNVTSTKDLTFHQAQELIADLSKIANSNSVIPERSYRESTKGKKYYGTGTRGQQRHLTALQAERIGILSDALGWDDARLRGFLKRQLDKNTAVQMLMNYEAGKVIVGLQRIFTDGNREYYLKINKLNNEQLKSQLLMANG
jgi:hypothetical protein